MTSERKHCDEYIDDEAQPACLREFLRFHRQPAKDKATEVVRDHFRDVPTLFAHNQYRIFATHNGVRVALIMASRFGDVGITADLGARNYDSRVAISELTDFSWEA